MNATFFYYLRRLRFALIAWSLGLFVLTQLVIQLYTVFAAEQGQALSEFVESLPKGLVSFAKLEDITSAKGFLDARFFTMMPILLGIFAALAGANLLVQDEEMGRLDLFLAYPVSRRSLFFGRLAALAVVLCLILLIAWLGMAIGITVRDINLSTLRLGFPFLSLFAVVLLTTSMGLLFSMVLPARRFAGMAAIFMLLASFFLSGFARIDESLLPLARLLPLYYHQGAEAMDQFNVPAFAGLLAATALCIGLAYWRFEARDIRVAGEGVMPWKKFAIGTGAAVILIAVPVALALQPKSYHTPEAAFDAAMNALAKEDGETFGKTLTREARDEWNSVLVAFGSMLHLKGDDLFSPKTLANKDISTEEMKAMFSMIGKFRSAMRYVETDRLKQHEPAIQKTLFAFALTGNLKVSDETRQLAVLVKEGDKFLAKSLQAWFVAYEYGKVPTLEQVRIEGDSATGIMILPNGHRQEIVFQKIDASWHVSLPFFAGEKRQFAKEKR